MIRLSDLDEKFFYDDEKEMLIGERSKKIYTLGTKVVVKVINASKELRQIDFTIYDEEKEVNDGKEKVKKIKKKY